mmetsp:Transcript_67621/g.119949  ORF Transcript_67621/g.119949 Transcript_67621/m.119949 type:complete len:206 (+) Transcript_67621:750-1367(+)
MERFQRRLVVAPGLVTDEVLAPRSNGHVQFCIVTLCDIHAIDPGPPTDLEILNILVRHIFGVGTTSSSSRTMVSQGLHLPAIGFGLIIRNPVIIIGIVVAVACSIEGVLGRVPGLGGVHLLLERLAGPRVRCGALIGGHLEAVVHRDVVGVDPDDEGLVGDGLVHTHLVRHLSIAVQLQVGCAVGRPQQQKEEEPEQGGTPHWTT